MPPSKSRTVPDDSRSEASSTREKLGTGVSATANGKNRRTASGLGMSVAGRDPTAVHSAINTTGPVGMSGAGQDTNAGVSEFLRLSCIN